MIGKAKRQSIIGAVILIALVSIQSYAEDISLLGDTAVSGNLNLTGPGKGIIFPDLTVQKTASREYVSTVLVSPVGTPSENGASLLSRLAAITDASSSTPYLLKIEPGIYDIGDNTLQMKWFVDIEGSGQTPTLIKGHPSSLGVVSGIHEAELRFLSIRHEGNTGGWAVAIYLSGVGTGTRGPLRISHVTAEATGGNPNMAIYCYDSSPLLSHVYAHAYGATTSHDYGIQAYKGTPKIEDSIIKASSSKQYAYGISVGSSCLLEIKHSDISARLATGWNYGIYHEGSSAITVLWSRIDAHGGTDSWGILNANTAGNIYVHNSVISGDSYGLRNDNNAATVRAGASQITGTLGTVKCAGVYDEAFTFHSDTCP